MVFSKKCSTCCLDLESTRFTSRKSSKDGLTGVCKTCSNIRRRKIYQKKHGIEPKVRYTYETRKIRRNAYEKMYRYNNPLVACKYRIRNLINKSLRDKNFTKNSKTLDIVGCSYSDLMDHLYRTWEINYGTRYNGEEVHIDHIVPLSSATTEEEVIKLNHYSNLQYLTPSDNLKKFNALNWSLHG